MPDVGMFALAKALEPPAAGKPPEPTPLDRVIEGLANADPSVVPAAGVETPVAALNEKPAP